MLQALRFTLIVFLISGIVYPLMITGLGQTLFPKQANGSLITNQSGVIIASSLIGQNFARPDYFHPRPSSNGYDAVNSGGSNYGPTNQKFIHRIQIDAVAYSEANAVNKTIPVDAVTTSASGLDPDISLANALAQVSRVARSRHIETKAVQRLVLSHQQEPQFSERPYVNVLELNNALDNLLVKK